MSEPLGETPKPNMEELFTKATVDKFLIRAGDIEKKYLRHYNQLVTRFDDSSIRAVLAKFGIPIEARVTVYGGFTGQFAESLRRIGMRVVFTDPMAEWVEHARNIGFESLKVSGQEIPGELLERTDLFASFECYPDLIGEAEFYYPIMRFLTVDYGIFFAESKHTVTNMREEEEHGDTQELGTFRRWFRHLYRVYGIKRKSAKTEHLNLYRILAELETRKVLAVDCRVMKVVHDTFVPDYRVTANDSSIIAARANLDQASVRLSIERLGKLSESIHAPFVKVIPFLAPQFKGSLNIGSKRFFFVS